MDDIYNMDSSKPVCCFTGHRPDKLPWGSCENDDRCVALNNEILRCVEEQYNKGYRHFICGMASGCDLYFAEAVLRLKMNHSDVILEAAVPCASQPDLWSKKLKEKYYNLLSQCDIAKILQQDYSDDCMIRRNRYMIQNSSAIIACFDGSSGGTMQTLLQAKRKNLEIILIDLNNYKDFGGF